jgi:hypothetical protein
LKQAFESLKCMEIAEPNSARISQYQEVYKV